MVRVWLREFIPQLFCLPVPGSCLTMFCKPYCAPLYICGRVLGGLDSRGRLFEEPLKHDTLWDVAHSNTSWCTLLSAEEAAAIMLSKGYSSPNRSNNPLKEVPEPVACSPTILVG